MEKFIGIIIQLLFLFRLIESTNLHGCHIDDYNTAACTLIPQCNNNSIDYLKQIKKFIFYNQLNKIEPQAFANCVFSNRASNNIELIFNSINEIKSFSFLKMIIDTNAKVNLVINGDAHAQQLVIRQNAFKGLGLGRNANFHVEITNYDQILFESNLIEEIMQDENSNVNFIFKKNNEILFLNSSIHMCTMVL